MKHRLYVLEKEEAVLGESLPLSELLLVPSADASIDISRSSSANKHNMHTLGICSGLCKKTILLVTCRQL